MTFLQKLIYTKSVLINLYYAWIVPNYAIKMAADSSLGALIRHNNPKIYRRYYMEYSCGGFAMSQTLDMILSKD